MCLKKRKNDKDAGVGPFFIIHNDLMPTFSNNLGYRYVLVSELKYLVGILVVQK